MAPNCLWLSVDGKVHISKTASVIGRDRNDIKELASVTEASIQEDMRDAGGQNLWGYVDLRCLMNEVVYDVETGTFETTVPGRKS